MCCCARAMAWPQGSMARSRIVGWLVQVVNPDSLSVAQLRLTPQHWSGPPGEQCYVDKVLLTQNDEMEEIYKVGQVDRSVSIWLDGGNVLGFVGWTHLLSASVQSGQGWAQQLGRRLCVGLSAYRPAE